MTTVRLTSPITGRAAMLARTARQARKPETGWSGATEAPAPRPRATWLEDLRNREQARQARIASWRASRFNPVDDRRPRPTQADRDRFAYEHRQPQTQEQERAQVEATRQRYARLARQAARGIAPAPGHVPGIPETSQSSGR